MSRPAPFRHSDITDYSACMAASFKRWTGKALIDAPREALAEALWRAPFILVSHDAQIDPVFRYGNLAALALWDMTWEQFTALPSRLSAEPDAREERERLLSLAASRGYVDNYSGVRITSTGKRFMIHDCILWNVVDVQGARIGQAARFDRWAWL